MVHISDDGKHLDIKTLSPESKRQLLDDMFGFKEVCFLRLPVPGLQDKNAVLDGIGELAVEMSKRLTKSATLAVFGDIIDLVHFHAAVANHLHYQLWIAVKREPMLNASTNTALPHQHVGILVYTKYDGQLRHTKTRLAYTYCPACNKTTKDYGGKKHTYNSYGTLVSDVWRAISVNPKGDIEPVIDRLADLFGVGSYRELRVYDLSNLLTKRSGLPELGVNNEIAPTPESRLVHGDALEQLRALPDNSVDFAFADPPYNLKKDYRGYADDLEIQDYFRWCDEWITETARVLRPGRTFALLNIPLWAIRHFLHLETVLTFQNWIGWDALSFPVRMIMPAHYTILCFSKGTPRPLPGLTGDAGKADKRKSTIDFQALAPLAEAFCLRSSCVTKRRQSGINDRGVLSDVWWDIHRLKHNTRRVDHPCQLPPYLLYRLLALFTEPGELVLDCFNGAGTTTLAAHQLGRRYIGIEREAQYFRLALERHHEIERGLDPFRKEERVLTAKNSPVARLKKQKYEVPKKTLQLEVRRVAQLIGHLPTRDEMIQHGEYPIRYYDEYFISWGEVCAAARNTGMKETRSDYPENTFSQKRLF